MRHAKSTLFWSALAIALASVMSGCHDGLHVSGYSVGYSSYGSYRHHPRRHRFDGFHHDRYYRGYHRGFGYRHHRGHFDPWWHRSRAPYCW